MDSMSWWARAASSKQFRFLIGPQEREFTIHSALVASQSPALDKLVNDTRFVEAQDGCARLREVDEDVFLAFVEYVYSGNYTTFDLPVDVGPYGDEMDPSQLAEAIAYSRAQTDPFAQSKGMKPKKTLLWEQFLNTVAPAPQPYLPPAPKTVTYWRDVNYAAGEALLSHARVYVFADYYGISRLTQLALHNIGKLLGLLRDAPLWEETAAFVKLLRFCYDLPAPEELRSLVVWFAAYEAETLWEDPGFREFVEGNGELKRALNGFKLLVQERMEGEKLAGRCR